ncbi:MAG: hypothetical protein KTR25_00035 [Myxococcales bacterium]|nr:hypothetical protein [Myxococcales bacterium]
MRTQLTLPVLFALGLAPLTTAFLLPPLKKNVDSEAPKVIQNAESLLLGLWNATAPEKEGDMVRFYYFHPGNIGLIRYGRLGLSYTQVFHWRVLPGSELTLTFTKTGELRRVKYHLDKGQAELRFDDDPVFAGSQTYRKRSPQRTHASKKKGGQHPFARLWVHETKGRNNARTFRMYQLQPPTIDGRGVGWFHEGDMAEWSTETLTYRQTNNRLTLDFPVRNERHSTSIELSGEGPNRTLIVKDDPRNFWHQRAYKDGGPGFTTMLENEPLPYHTPTLYR